jgi:hypothetical protein
MIGRFAYSNVSSHLVAAVLAEALGSADEPSTILDYARVKLFDPLASIFHLAGLGRCDGLRITVLV